MRKVGAAGILLFFLMSVLALPAFAAEVKEKAEAAAGGGIPPVLEPVRASFVKLGGYLPKLGGLLLILVIGALVAVGVAALLRIILDAIKLEQGAKKAKILEILKKGGIGLSLSDLIIEIVFFLIIIVTLITALEFYGLVTSVFTSQILSYIPNVIAAVFILILGILLAILISGIIKLVGGNVKIAQSDTLGNIAKYAIIIVAGLIALRELGLRILLTANSMDIILGGLALGLALAFGLGAKDRAGKFLNNIFKG